MKKDLTISRHVQERAKDIKLLVMDVDGVLTPGYMFVTDSGNQAKIFDVQDGFGIMLWQKAGFYSAIITAGKSPAIEHRADSLKIDKVYQEAKDKGLVYEKLKKHFKVSDEQVCFIGDDLIDIPILKRAGLACSVQNAHKDIQPYVHYRCELAGGKGAVREIIDIILKAKDLWGDITKEYFK
jgi:3-deoxy-D-manno-octulosonate 8-phosphate phosphatase (KDO 8-P phosphatase)